MFKKALTFSYDDGVTQDKRLIEIFNKYGLKGTFNLNSELFGNIGKNNIQRISSEEIKSVYAGHEIAVHTLTHPFLHELDDDRVVKEIEQDRINLSEIAGYEVVGMAYPFGEKNNGERIADLIKSKTGVKYARSTDCTGNFKRENDLLHFKATSFHLNWNEIFDLAEKFLSLNTDELSVFYIWGHSYELDFNDKGWQKIEDFCKMISGHKDIFYGTNREVLLSDNW